MRASVSVCVVSCNVGTEHVTLKMGQWRGEVVL